MNAVWQSRCSPSPCLEPPPPPAYRRSRTPTRPCARMVQGLACKASYAGSIPATASVALTRQNKRVAPPRGCHPFGCPSQFPSQFRSLNPQSAPSPSEVTVTVSQSFLPKLAVLRPPHEADHHCATCRRGGAAGHRKHRSNDKPPGCLSRPHDLLPSHLPPGSSELGFEHQRGHERVG